MRLDRQQLLQREQRRRRVGGRRRCRAGGELSRQLQQQLGVGGIVADSEAR